MFGPESKYKYSADLRYKPPLAPLEDYLEHSRKFGIGRYVFVQPSAYGRDNTCMLDAMREVGSACRGIVDVDEGIADAELARLHALGVRGIRVNVNPVKPFEAGFSRSMLSRIEILDKKSHELGWMLDFLTPGWLTHELIPVMQKLKSRFSIAHMGMFRAGEKGFADFLFLIASTDAWPKLTGLYRISNVPGYADVAGHMRAIVEVAADRALWGSDYPHLSFADRTSTDELFGFFSRTIVDEKIRNMILVDNPARCFGF